MFIECMFVWNTCVSPTWFSFYIRQSKQNQSCFRHFTLYSQAGTNRSTRYWLTNSKDQSRSWKTDSRSDGQI